MSACRSRQPAGPSTPLVEHHGRCGSQATWSPALPLPAAVPAGYGPCAESPASRKFSDHGCRLPQQVPGRAEPNVTSGPAKDPAASCGAQAGRFGRARRQRPVRALLRLPAARPARRYPDCCRRPERRGMSQALYSATGVVQGRRRACRRASRLGLLPRAAAVPRSHAGAPAARHPSPGHRGTPGRPG